MPRLQKIRFGSSPASRALLALLLTATISLSGCGDETAQPQAASAAASAPSSLPSTRASGASTLPTSNRAPTISGTPVSALNAASIYSFTPASADADGDGLAFSIANKPVWATFDTVTGKLTGTPTLANVGTYANILISVSDGVQAASLKSFSIAVTQTSSGRVTLSWMPPTENADGSQLTNLSGYRIYYGTAADALTSTIDISNASVASYVVENLSPATWFFAIRSLAGSLESDLSTVASKTIS